ncbi:hypothetical protein WDZ17_06995, partial [Pseudokineococcus basanitobsidens]
PPMQSGVTWLALQTGAPVVPVALLGTRGPGSTYDLPRPRQPVHVVFGAPVSLQARAGVPRRDALQQATEDLRSAMTAHVHDAVERTGMPLPEDVERPPGHEEA